MLDDRRLIQQALHVSAPWHLYEIKLDPPARRCDVWIGQKPASGWFGIRRGAPRAQKTWRHLNTMNLQTWVHVTPPLGASLGDLNWAGDDGLPFTHAMSRQLFALFDEGLTLEAICRLFDIDVKDLWRYKFALDRGRTGLQSPAPAAEPARVPAETPQNPEAVDVPDVGDPVWLQLAQGQRSLDIRLLGLKLLLNRIRTQYEAIDDNDVRRSKLHELHRFFVKNSRLLRHELEQLREAA